MKRCGWVSGLDFRRWIHDHKLPTRFPQSPSSSIAVSDLEPFLPGHVQKVTIEGRIEGLERRVQALEQQVQHSSVDQKHQQHGVHRAERRI